MRARLTCLMAVCAIACLAAQAAAQAPQGMGYGYGAPTGVPVVMPANAMMAMQGGGCSSGYCDGGYDVGCCGDAGCCGDSGCCGGGGCCGCIGCCAPCGWSHKVMVFGEYLYMRSRDSEVTYAVESNNNTSPQLPTQRGGYGVVDQDFNHGFRAGFGFALNNTNAITFTYTMFETQSTDTLDRRVVLFGVQSRLLHPNTVNVGLQADGASATHSISYDLIDADYRALIHHNCNTQIAAVVGARYGTLEQQLQHSLRNNNQGNVSGNTVATDIDFSGVGLRLGLDAKRCFSVADKAFFNVYAKSNVSFLAGEFRGTYAQGNQFDNTIIDTSWKAGRIVPMYDIEVGTGLCSKCGTWSVNVGYVFNAWANVVKTDDFITAVHTNNFNDVGDTITFDGVVGRIEAKY